MGGEAKTCKQKREYVLFDGVDAGHLSVRGLSWEWGWKGGGRRVAAQWLWVVA